MHSDIKYYLVGYLRPPGKLLGFIMPVFQAQDEYFAQKIDSMNNVSGFSIVDERDVIKLSKGLPSWTTKIGNTALYAFSCGDEKIVWSSKVDLGPSLRKSISTLRAYPFVLIDVAKFLDDAKLLSDALHLAYEDLLRLSPEVARKWAVVNMPTRVGSIDSSLKDQNLEIENSTETQTRQEKDNLAARAEPLKSTGSEGKIKPRSYARTAYHAPIQFAILNTQQFHKATTLDFSADGLCFKTNQALDLWTEICIVMDNYRPGQSGPEGFRSYVVRVCWINMIRDDLYEVGAQYIARSHEILATEDQLERKICYLCGTMKLANRIETFENGVLLCRECIRHFANIPSEKFRKHLEHFLKDGKGS